MSKKITIEHLYTTGNTSPNDLLFGEIAISHGGYYSEEEKKNYGPRIYTRSDGENEKNIEYIPSWEIERTVVERSNKTATTSNFGFVNIFSGDTEDILNQISDKSSTTTVEKTKIKIKPGYGINEACKLQSNINIINNEDNNSRFNDLIIELSRSDFFGDTVSIVCERINDMYPSFITEKKNHTRCGRTWVVFG